MTIAVYIVDDDASIRESLLALLATDEGLHAAAFADGASFLQAVDDGVAPGVVLLDLMMPEQSGFAVLQKLFERTSDFAPIIITAHGSTRQAVQAARIGAVDFLEKPFDWAELFEAILAANDRLRTVEDGSAAASQERLLDQLTPRERDVLRLVLAGHMSKNIAGILGMSARTAEVHRSHIMRKLGATSQLELVNRLIADKSVEIVGGKLALKCDRS